MNATMSLKKYSQHNCNSKHRTVKTFLKCAIPKVNFLHGRGHIAVIAWCRVPTVSLWTHAHDAAEAKRMIDDSACGGLCRRRHDIVEVILP